MNAEMIVYYCSQTYQGEERIKKPVIYKSGFERFLHDHFKSRSCKGAMQKGKGNPVYQQEQKLFIHDNIYIKLPLKYEVYAESITL